MSNNQQKIKDLRASLIEESRVRLGMSNAAEVKRQYEVILLSLIDIVGDLADSVASLSSSETVQSK